MDSVSAARNALRGYLPIGDYALIGDERTTALVARDGAIDWWCWPDVDSPAVLCRLLDTTRGGFFQIAPSVSFTSTRRYVPDTNVLETTFTTASGRVRLTDLLALSPGTDSSGVAGSSRCLGRLVEGIDGVVMIEARFRPTFDYARVATEWTVAERRVTATGADLRLTLDAPVPLAVDSDAATARLEVRAGDRKWFLVHDGAFAGSPERLLNEAVVWWTAWARQCTYSGPYDALVRRSALVLKLLTFDPTGAVVAAPTTSLPEEIGGTRNWDYRFTWLRDSALILQALIGLGYHHEAMRFFRWLERICLECRDGVQIMYTVRGALDLPEEVLPHLEGYRRSPPVRIGNEAASQRQLDVAGEVIDAIYLCATTMDVAHERSRALVRVLANKAAASWRDADQGIWEVRTGPRHFLYSKLLCWVAMDRAIALLAQQADDELQRWRGVRDEIRTAIEEQGFDRDLGAFVQAFDSRVLDASVLAIPLVGFLPATDPRMVATVATIRRDLTANGLVYRYRTDDGVAGGEATFAICSFWLVDNLALAGRIDEARELFEQVVGYANDVGLLAEEIAPASRELLGNFPQGFTHLALIRSAMNLASGGEGQSTPFVARASFNQP